MRNKAEKERYTCDVEPCAGTGKVSQVMHAEFRRNIPRNVRRALHPPDVSRCCRQARRRRTRHPILDGDAHAIPKSASAAISVCLPKQICCLRPHIQVNSSQQHQPWRPDISIVLYCISHKTGEHSNALKSTNYKDDATSMHATARHSRFRGKLAVTCPPR